MTVRTEYDAAYFTLLRAIEERDSLLAYREFLQAERHRLDEFAEHTTAAEQGLPRKLARPVAQTSKQLLEGVGRRRSTVLEELRRIDDRIAAAESFVQECEQEVARLRR